MRESLDMGRKKILAEVVRVLRLEGQSILECADRLQSKNENGEGLEKVVDCLCRVLEGGGKLIVTGVGKSGKVAQKIAATLSSTGSLAIFLHPTEGLHGDLGVVQKKDAVLALSYTGNTEELIRLLPSLKAMGVPIIGIGGNASSQLGQSADYWLDASVSAEACPHNLAPTSSTTLALALGDALAVALMQLRGFDSQAFALNHPGGSLGRRLHMKVSDLMHTGESVARASPDASMHEVVIASTDKKLGIVLVVEGTQLKGIITDGDIRRSLQVKEKFFTLKASDVMTRNPVVISPESMAHSAIDIMENRKSQISVLPVVDEQMNWKGVLRLHDLIRIF